MAENGVKTSTLAAFSTFDDLIGNKDGSTGRVMRSDLIRQVSSAYGPAFETLAELEANLAWPAETLAVVWNDETNSGDYRKKGDTGTGSWVFVGESVFPAAIQKIVSEHLLTEAARAVTEAARDAAFVNANVYADEATGRAAVADGEQFQVVVGSEIVRYERVNASGSTRVASWVSLVPFLVPKKNLFDKSQVRAGERYSPAADAIITDINGRCTGFIPVTPGDMITISGGEDGFTGGWFATAADTGGLDLGYATGTQITVTVPSGRYFLVVNLTTTNNAGYDDTLQIEVGTKATDYEGYALQIDPALVRRLADVSIIDEVGTNLIDLDQIDFVKRYSVVSQAFIADANGIAKTGYIPVAEGQTYVLSGAYYSEADPAQGGYCSTFGQTTGFMNISFTTAANNDGVVFTVPEGLGYAYVVLNLWKDGRTPGSTALEGEVQLQVGEIATAHEAYEVRQVVSESNLPKAVLAGGGSAGTVALNDAVWFKYVEGEPQPLNRDKWPVFSKKMLLKSADVTVVSVGTSLTARTTEHHSDHPQASTRPPLMHSLNEASYLWDAMSHGWEGQKYARYDDATVVGEDSGTWATSHNLAEWDDGAYRNGLTRYSETAGAAITFTVPAGAWAWRLIHRTDSVASTALQVTISAGNGVAEVYDDGTSAWIEANGYTFSQREAAPVMRSISIPDPDTDVFAASAIASKGNTTYQKRLNLRFVDRASAKTVTITNTDGATRFNYWGCEWSPREFMLTYVNAARGSHNTVATSALGLPRFADNEVHAFAPDLIYGELPIHNDGAAGIDVHATWDRWGRLSNNYVWRADYELSLKARATTLGYTPELGWWTPSIAYGFGGISEGGELLTSTMTDGRVMTALDKFDQAVAWVRENHPGDVMIHGARRWVEAGLAIYGDLKTATEASSKTGPSMTNDGGHSNDIGAKVLAKLIVGPLDFSG